VIDRVHLQVAETLAEELVLSQANGEAKRGLSLDAHLLRGAASQVLRHTAVEPGAELTIVLTDDEEVHALNRQFLGVDSPTDVLAFPLSEVDPDSQAVYLGDVVISFPRAQAQALAGGHSLEAELQLLVVHGVLHLVGYDHADPGGKAAMWAAQAQILAQVGCAIIAPPE